jgi:Dinucleotide-utilizing enzymes involved in molybdopterin and thiamine biosynthesis family 2
MTDDEIYQRQQELDLNPPKTITVIGVGGVGSWVALDLALAGVEKIYMVDHDHIETHNLNRTPFKESQVDQDKVTALTELVSERRIDAEPVPITDRIENLAEHSGRK